MPLAYQYDHQYPRTKDMRSPSLTQSRQSPGSVEDPDTEVKHSQQSDHETIPETERPGSSQSSMRSMDAFLDSSDAKTAGKTSRAK
jgi:hypothetical protein